MNNANAPIADDAGASSSSPGGTPPVNDANASIADNAAASSSAPRETPSVNDANAASADDARTSSSAPRVTPPVDNANPALPDAAPRVVVETSMGNFTIGLYEDVAPITVANFLAYVDAGFFPGTAFHRVIPGFMIQGGGYVPSGGRTYQNKDRLPAIALESGNGLSNLRGTVAMARAGMPDTASSEFFVNLVDNRQLDRRDDTELGYAVFGVVLDGMDTVDAIAAVDTDFSPTFSHTAAPVEDIVIRSIRRR